MPEKFAVLDTNVFGIAADLNSPLWVSLKRLCAETEVVLGLPEVVLQEAINLRREQYQEVAREFLEANKRISKFYDLPGVYVPDVDEVVGHWEADLRGMFQIIPTAAEDAVAALAREASRIAPARGGRGARDSLVWLTCARLASAGSRVIFVSRNTKDFAAKSGTELHQDLAAEIANLEGSLRYFASLDGLFESLASKVDGPNLTDSSFVAENFTFDLWDYAVDLLALRDLAGEHMLDLSVTMSEPRVLRAYAVDDRGLALIDGTATLIESENERSLAEMKFMAWVEFDLETKQPLRGELEQVVATKSPPS